MCEMCCREDDPSLIETHRDSIQMHKVNLQDAMRRVEQAKAESLAAHRYLQRMLRLGRIRNA